jgi:hypothetical protein
MICEWYYSKNFGCRAPRFFLMTFYCFVLLYMPCQYALVASMFFFNTACHFLRTHKKNKIVLLHFRFEFRSFYDWINRKFSCVDMPFWFGPSLLSLDSRDTRGGHIVWCIRNKLVHERIPLCYNSIIAWQWLKIGGFTTLLEWSRICSLYIMCHPLWMLLLGWTQLRRGTNERN